MLDLGRRFGRAGVDAVLDATSNASSPTVLTRFLEKATSVRHVRSFLKGLKHLMREESITELERLIAIAAELEDPRAFGWEHLPWLMRACRTYGVEAALPMRGQEPRTGRPRHQARELRAVQ